MPGASFPFSRKTKKTTGWCWGLLPLSYSWKSSKKHRPPNSENRAYRPFTANPAKWPVQVYFLTSACVDVVVEYFQGGFSVSLDTVTEVVLTGVEKLAASRPTNR